MKNNLTVSVAPGGPVDERLHQRLGARLSATRLVFVSVTLLLYLPAVSRADAFECLLEPVQVVEIRSSVEGLIQRVHVQRGEEVRAGQVLVELESDAERSAVALAKYRTEAEGKLAATTNRMEYATGKADRAAKLHAQNYISIQARDEALAEKRLAESEHKEALEGLEMARLEYQRVLALLNQRTLKSPFKGVVAERMLNPGDLAESGNGRKPILKLAQIDPLRVEVVLPHASYGKVRVGNSARVALEGGTVVSAIVRVVDRVFDAASGTYGVRLELPNPKGTIPSGIRCRVEFPQISGLATKKGQGL